MAEELGTVLDVSTAVAVVSTLIAVASLALNWLMVRRQVQLQLEELRASADAEKLRWFRETLGAFAEAKALAGPGAAAFAPADYAERQVLARERLSVLADEGRLYFPNVDPDGYGAAKSEAFRGRRQPALDAILLAYDLVGRLDGGAALGSDGGHGDPEAARAFLFECRRLFVSEVQRSIEPRRREAMLRGGATGPGASPSQDYAEVRALMDRMEALSSPATVFEDVSHMPAAGSAETTAPDAGPGRTKGAAD